MVTPADTPEELLTQLDEELVLLQHERQVETSFLIHPHTLVDFESYNQFLNACDDLLSLRRLNGVFQIASFHPDFQYANTQFDDPENYANRSPYPMLHILRESSVEQAVAEHPDVDAIPDRNIRVLEATGSEELRTRWLKCLS